MKDYKIVNSQGATYRGLLYDRWNGTHGWPPEDWINGDPFVLAQLNALGYQERHIPKPPYLRPLDSEGDQPKSPVLFWTSLGIVLLIIFILLFFVIR